MYQLYKNIFEFSMSLFQLASVKHSKTIFFNNKQIWIGYLIVDWFGIIILSVYVQCTRRYSNVKFLPSVIF